MRIIAPNFIILFVADPLTSAAFYTKILGLAPAEQSPTFVMFVFPNGIRLGLWSKKTAYPVVTASAGGCEVAFTEKDVDALHTLWNSLGVTIAQEPIDNEAGRNFVALDPDGNRLRVFWQAGE